MRRELKDRRVLLTGASSGIGRALAEQLANQGARLALVARSADKLAELARQLTNRGVDAHAMPADITSEEQRQGLMEHVRSILGGLDVLINNAGVASWAHFADSTEAILRQIMEVNFFAPVELTRRAIPLLVQGKQPAVVMVASMCGRRAMPAWPEYSASKYALCGMSEALRGELARFDIDVLLMVPGLTRSGLHDHLLLHQGRAQIDFSSGQPPEQVAREIVRAIQANRRETVIGQDARWVLLVNRFFPRLVDWLIARRVKKLYSR